MNMAALIKVKLCEHDCINKGQTKVTLLNVIINLVFSTDQQLGFFYKFAANKTKYYWIRLLLTIFRQFYHCTSVFTRHLLSIIFIFVCIISISMGDISTNVF